MQRYPTAFSFRQPSVSRLASMAEHDTDRHAHGRAGQSDRIATTESATGRAVSALNGWPAHAAVDASPATLRAACAGCLVTPADASLAVIVVRYSFRCGGLAPPCFTPASTGARWPSCKAPEAMAWQRHGERRATPHAAGGPHLRCFWSSTSFLSFLVWAARFRFEPRANRQGASCAWGGLRA